MAFARREDKDITIENIKVTVKNLLDRNIIININERKIDMESFKFITDENVEILEVENQAVKNCDSLENFINDKLYETLVYKIKEEIKHAK